MLEYVPASFVVLRHVRPKLSCARCASIVQAPAPGRPIDHGVAGPGLLAGFNKLYEDGAIQQAPCMAHIRRKFYDLMEAHHSPLARWDALLRYLDDGRIEIDNSAAERALRAVAVGRRNYLLAGSDRGGERAAVFYSLIGSAKLNGMDPEAYLRHVLGRIVDHSINRIEELLPWNVAPNLAPASQSAA